MSKKPTYEELEKRVKNLEKECDSLRRAEEDLRTEEEFLSAIYSNSEISIFVISVSENGEYVYEGVNPMHERLLGISNKDIIGKAPDDLIDFLGAETVQHAKNIYDECIQKKETLEDEFYISKGPARGWWLTKLTPIMDTSSGRVHRLVGSGMVITEKKMFQKDLMEIRQHLSMAQEIAHIGSWKYDVRTNELFWSEEMYRIYGLDPETTKATVEHGIGMIHPEDRKIAENAFNKALKEGASYTMQYRINRPDGTERIIEGMGKIEKDHNGDVLSVYGAGQDITDRARVERTLIEKDTMLANIASQVPGMLYQFKMAPDGKYSVPYSSNGVKDIFGFTPEEVRDDFNSIFNVFHPDDRGMIMQTIDESAKNMSQWMCEYRVKISDQPVKWVFGNSIPEKKPDGSIIWSGYNLDITDRKRVESALMESEEQFRNFFEHLTIGVAVYEAVDDGEDFIFSDMNPAGQKLSNLSLDNIQGQRLTHIFPRVKELGLLQALQDVWRTGKPAYVPFSKYEDKRITQWVENRVFRLPSGKVVAVYDDRTEQVRLEEGLRQAQKMEAIGTLAGGIAHDFNNMLGIITGNISYALSVLNQNNELFEVLSDAMRASKQAQDLTHQLLTFAKGGEPIKKACNINNLIKESAKLFTSGTNSKCELKLDDDLLTAEVDKGQINQVVSNLVINADQAMPHGGIIVIRTENIAIGIDSDLQLEPGNYIKISIEDQGIGIQERDIANIFDPYFTTKQKGSGLGLATAYSIVKKHGGNIIVLSEPGKGSVFSIYLLASLKEIVETEIKEENRHQGHGRILIMDDQESILRMVERILGRMGYESETALDGIKAIKLYGEAYRNGNPFDLVILDLTVPGGMGGAETMQELLKIDSEVKAVVSSGYSNDPIMANYSEYGFCGVVPKPYSKNELAKILNTVF